MYKYIHTINVFCYTYIVTSKRLLALLKRGIKTSITREGQSFLDCSTIVVFVPLYLISLFPYEGWAKSIRLLKTCFSTPPLIRIAGNTSNLQKPAEFYEVSIRTTSDAMSLCKGGHTKQIRFFLLGSTTKREKGLNPQNH